MFAHADQLLHNMIDDISKAEKTLKGTNTNKSKKIVELLRKAHSLIHDLNY